MPDLPLPGIKTAQPGQSRISGSVTLDGVSIRVLLSMNSRTQLWRLGIADSVGRWLIQGHPLVALADVFPPYRARYGALLPPGALFAYPIAGDGASPRNFGAWSSSHEMVYRTAA